MTRVLVAAASAIVRSGLESIVRYGDALELIASVDMGEVRDGLGEAGTDVVLVALSNVDEDWLRTLSEIGCPVLLLTEEPETHMLTGNLRSVLRFDARPEEVVAALLAVAEGLVVLHPSGWREERRGYSN